MEKVREEKGSVPNTILIASYLDKITKKETTDG